MINQTAVDLRDKNIPPNAPIRKTILLTVKATPLIRKDILLLEVSCSVFFLLFLYMVYLFVFIRIGGCLRITLFCLIVFRRNAFCLPEVQVVCKDTVYLIRIKAQSVGFSQIMACQSFQSLAS